jgi:hypothetical protein
MFGATVSPGGSVPLVAPAYGKTPPVAVSGWRNHDR